MKIPGGYVGWLRHEQAPHLVATIDTQDRCLLLYPRQRWLDIEEQIAKLPSLDPAARRVQRLLIGHATDLSIDANDRILIPPVLRDFANLDREAMLVGQGNKFEIWSQEEWDSQRSQWLSQDNGEITGLPDELRDISL